MQLRTVAIVGVLAMAGCGGDDDQPASDVNRPATPVYCPSEDGGAAGAPGTAAPFDARDILGQSPADAESTAKDHDCTVRIVVEDGEERPQTMDLRTDRINVEVRDGVVLLTGTVQDRRDRWRIEDVVEQIRGVREVTNRIKLARST